ncbi:MAG: hypothetical protein KAS32_21335 [Candidatus Peribacteraceae bacterium]|nr:hypothetical protein [Candidatus Peribacteraceae bacterium]
MIPWQKTSGLKVPQAECIDWKEEPFELYRNRYKEPSSILRVKDAERYVEEAIGNIEGTLLVVGSGHSDHCNVFKKELPGVAIIASDFVEEAKIGLSKNISFFTLDLLGKYEEGLKFDYVFSAHTLEHFSKENLFGVVWPHLISLASKAVITVVPYGSSWEDEPSHKCKFFEDDEFAGLQDKYKIIFNGHEILFWKDTR